MSLTNILDEWVKDRTFNIFWNIACRLEEVFKDSEDRILLEDILNKEMIENGITKEIYFMDGYVSTGRS